MTERLQGVGLSCTAFPGHQMPTHEKGQAESLVLGEGLYPRGSASDGPARNSEAGEKKFLEAVMTFPALGFIV